MNHSNPGKGNGPGQDKHAGDGPGEEIPKRPADSNASGEANNDTGEDNQRQKGERPAGDYVRK
ncbi:hypothetical protein [Frateuria terrea]|uniref:Uncharacterized protein n=1 Tax=Frateuria terrea TaxID=529704 RepID=A0A1H6VAG2_9GAMM|nr:hypothetical protein [Frateuria terrea]SEJ01548.1 hypothetical protein SAMN04487997_2206 [Frateuria terrea]SFP64954.1 hypothetical protein SAMN02927913_3024 [Frateuria terrea]